MIWYSVRIYLRGGGAWKERTEGVSERRMREVTGMAGLLKESIRNWLVQLELEALETGKSRIEEVTDEEVSDEMRESFSRGLAYLKMVRDELGPEEFSKITIDVGYDY